MTNREKIIELKTEISELFDEMVETNTIICRDDLIWSEGMKDAQKNNFKAIQKCALIHSKIIELEEEE